MARRGPRAVSCGGHARAERVGSNRRVRNAQSPAPSLEAPQPQIPRAAQPALVRRYEPAATL